MAKAWILVAHRGGARLFEHEGREPEVTLHQALDHPAGRLKNREIGSDKHGRSFDRQGAGRHAYTTEAEPTEHVAAQFARQLASMLEEGREQGRYQRLILIAEPRFLGLLRAELSAPTAALVAAELDKDLGDIEARDLPKHLEGVLPS